MNFQLIETGVIVYHEPYWIMRSSLFKKHWIDIDEDTNEINGGLHTTSYKYDYSYITLIKSIYDLHIISNI